MNLCRLYLLLILLSVSLSADYNPLADLGLKVAVMQPSHGTMDGEDVIFTGDFQNHLSCLISDCWILLV